MQEGDNVVKPVVYWAYKSSACRRKQRVEYPQPEVPLVVPPKPACADRKFPDCYGCWGGSEPHPSQRYHMREGGCLYDGTFFEK